MIWLVIGLILGQMHFTNAKMKPKVVQGVEVGIDEYGYCAFYIVLGKDSAKFSCGGSIINQNIILTAAHCFEIGVNESKSFVTLGHHNRSEGLDYGIKRVKVHEKYNVNTVINDIALILLTRNITFGKRMFRIPLAKATPKKDSIGTVAGWGDVQEPSYKNKKPNYILYATEQTIWTKESCHKMIKTPPKTFCAGDTVSVSYPTFGDSGSGLVVNNHIVGIVSFNMAMNLGLTVYTDVSFFNKWITKNVITLICINNS